MIRIFSYISNISSFIQIFTMTFDLILNMRASVNYTLSDVVRVILPALEEFLTLSLCVCVRVRACVRVCVAHLILTLFSV
jgi:hypothetical protein